MFTGSPERELKTYIKFTGSEETQDFQEFNFFIDVKLKLFRFDES